MNAVTKVIFRNALVTLILFFTLPLLFGAIVRLFDKSILPAKHILRETLADIELNKQNLIFWFTQVIVIVLIAVIFGNRYERNVKAKPLLVVNAVSILLFWLALLCSALIFNLVVALLRNDEHIFNNFLYDIVMGVSAAILLALVNFIVIGAFMGRSLK